MLAEVEADIAADQVRPALDVVGAELVEIIAGAPEEADFGAFVPHAVLAALAERRPVHRQAVEQAAARRVAVDRQRAAADRAGLPGDRATHLVRTKFALVQPGQARCGGAMCPAHLELDHPGRRRRAATARFGIGEECAERAALAKLAEADERQAITKSEERRVGKECTSKGRSRWAAYH